MKKILALILAVIMMFSLVACGGGAESNEPSSKPVANGSDIDENGEDKGELVLEGKDEFVVCVKMDSDLKINSIKEIEGLNVGAIFDSDGYKIAEYFGANVVGFGGDLDTFSTLSSGDTLDCALFKKMSAESYQQEGKLKIILDPIVIE